MVTRVMAMVMVTRMAMAMAMVTRDMVMTMVTRMAMVMVIHTTINNSHAKYD